MLIRTIATGLVVLALVQFSAPAAAAPPMPTIRVVSDQAGVFGRADRKSPVTIVAPAGTVFEVIDKEGDWYWVLMTRDANGTRQSGWIESRYVEIVTPAARGAAPRSLTGEVDVVQTALAGPRDGSRGPTGQSDAHLLKALRDLEQARREYEAVTTSASGAR